MSTYLNRNVHNSIIHNNQKKKKMETTQMSINWWLGKQNVLYMYSGVLSGNKKESSSYIPLFCAQPGNCPLSPCRSPENYFLEMVRQRISGLENSRCRIKWTISHWKKRNSRAAHMPLWWLILCVNLSGLRDALITSKHYFRCICKDASGRD